MKKRITAILLLMAGVCLAQDSIDLRSKPKEVGVAIYCPGVVETAPSAKVRVTILNPINGSYPIGTQIPVDIEIRNVSNTVLPIPTQPASEKLISKDEKFPVKIIQMCIHTVGDDTYVERCLTGRTALSESFVLLRPDESITLHDTIEVALLNPKSFTRAYRDGYTMSLSTYVSFSSVSVSAVPRKYSNDCFIPMGESARSNLASITVTSPRNAPR
jgi:hypothetical protein